MKKLLISMLLVMAMYASSIAAPIVSNNQIGVTAKHAIVESSSFADSNIRDSGWKTSERFELSYIDGYQEVYNAAEPIVIYVEGKSDKMDVDKANGFYAGAIIYDSSSKTSESNAVAEYDPSRRAWLVKLTAPKDNTKKYEISVALFCSKNESPCATLYGSGTQINKELPLQVR